jgi:hypothetical protein
MTQQISATTVRISEIFRRTYSMEQTPCLEAESRSAVSENPSFWDLEGVLASSKITVPRLWPEPEESSDHRPALWL